jgi:ribosome-binding ATPase YchF (GTP1/OBG family)
MLVINGVLALGTFILAIVGIYQARAARDAANEAKRQADALDRTLGETKKIAEAAISNTEAAKKQALVLEKSFLFTHRPKLIVRNVMIKRAVADGGVQSDEK